MDLNQITLPAKDYGEAVDFYERLGLSQIVATEHGYARFETTCGQTLSIHTDPAASIGSAIIYFECQDLDGTVEQLIARGIAFDEAPEDKGWLWREARLKDPTGNILCLYNAGENRRFPPWRVDGAKQ